MNVATSTPPLRSAAAAPPLVLNPEQLKAKPTLCALQGKLYDISSFSKVHPGGDHIVSAGALDATALFKSVHPTKDPASSKILQECCVGVYQRQHAQRTVSPPPLPPTKIPLGGKCPADGSRNRRASSSSASASGRASSSNGEGAHARGGPAVAPRRPPSPPPMPPTRLLCELPGAPFRPPMAAAAAVPPLQRPDPHARPPEPRPQRSLPAAVLPPPPAAKKARGPKAKAKQKLVYVESTQRTLGKQFHSMQKTLRIVSLSGNDPLVNDFVWLALCSDLVAIGFCNANCSRFIRRKRADFDGVPLALRPHNSDWTVYRRVLNQIPLLHAVHLAAFRWVCFLCTNRVKRASGAGDLPATTLLEINERAAAFLRRLVRPSFDVPAFLAQDPREPLPADASTAKVKFRLTSIGQKLLINSCSTFQPVVPQNLRSRLESSLRSPVLHCPIPVLASDSTSSEERQMPLYVHELSKRTRENEMIDLGGLKWEPYNGERRNGANSTQIVRRCVLQHLCGYIEGCAIFGLRQLFGNGAEFMDRVAMVEHFVEAVGKAVVPDPAEPAASEAAFYLRASPSRHCVGGKLAARGGGGGKAGAGAGAERKDEQQTKYIGRQKRRHRGGEAPPIVSKKSATHLSAAARKRKRKQKKTKAAAAVAQGKKAKKAKTLPHDSSSEEASMLLLLLASTAK